MTAMVRPGRQRGAALMLVLWLLTLMMALVGAFVVTARIEHLQGRVLRDGMVAGEAARAGVEFALGRIADPDPRARWRIDGREYDWRFGDADVRVRVVDESGKVDLNRADAVLLAALLRGAGAAPERVDALAAAILDWRDADSLTQPGGDAEDPGYAAAGLPYGAKDAPFESTAELEQVLGMTPAVYARLAPLVTVYGETMPKREFAPPAVLTAMGLDPRQVGAEREGMPSAGLVSGSGTYSIESRAMLGSGRSTALRVVVRSGGQGVAGSTASAYTILRWQEGLATP